MKKKLVYRYTCDFCGKKNYSASAMNKHEKHCTKNPDRKCRMCELIGENYNLKQLISEIPKPIDFNGESGVDFSWYTNIDEINNAINNIKKSVNCPACILAAIRQNGINVPATNFNITKEFQTFWDSYNDDHCDQPSDYFG
jgi:hypothetical protein